MTYMRKMIHMSRNKQKVIFSTYNDNIIFPLILKHSIRDGVEDNELAVASS